LGDEKRRSETKIETDKLLEVVFIQEAQ